MKLKELCDSLEKELPLSNAEVFEPYTIPDGYPWKDKTTDDCNMYACLYGLAEYDGQDLNILEIGTGWGISGLMWLRLQGLDGRFITIDRGGFEDKDNVKVVRRLLDDNPFCERDFMNFPFLSFEASTQLIYENVYDGDRSISWIAHNLLAACIQTGVDILFIDGDHGDKDRPWALFNDLWQFWPYLRPGGLCICDDIHDPFDYVEGRFPWLPYTWYSFWQFNRMMGSQIEDCRVWKYPYVPSGKRPVGLLRKKL